MLDNLREGARGPFGKIIVLVLVLAFGLFGVSTVVPLVFSGSAPVTVNGEDISAAQVQQRTAQERQRILQQLGGQIDPSAITEDMVRPQAIEQLVQQRVLSQAAQNAGLALSEREIDRLLVQQPAFQSGGAFDSAAFARVAAQQGMSAAQLRARLAGNGVTNQWVAGIERGGFVLPQDLERYGRLVNQSRSAGFVRFAPADFIAEVTLSDSAIETFYEDNQDGYKTPEQARVDYVHLSRQAIASSVSVSEQAVRDAYDAEVRAAADNAQRAISHIMIRADERSDEAARARAEELRGKAVTGDFSELAQAHSEDPGSAAQGGTLGIYQPGIFSTEFENAVLGLDEPGAVSSVVETEFGFHIIRLDELVSDDIAPYAERAPDLRASLRENAIDDRLSGQRDALADSAFASLTLAPVSADFDLPVQTTQYFTRAKGSGMAANEAVRSAAFSPQVQEDEANSDVIVLPDNSLVVLHGAGYKPSSVQPLAEVSETIRGELTARQARESASTAADELYSQLADKDLAAARADGAGIETVSGLTRFDAEPEAALVDAIFSVAEPDSDPVPFRTSLDSGVSVVGEVTAARAGELDADEQADTADFIRQTFTQMVLTGTLTELREQADVRIR